MGRDDMLLKYYLKQHCFAMDFHSIPTTGKWPLHGWHAADTVQHHTLHFSL
jgi:hypothetical protein